MKKIFVLMLGLVAGTASFAQNAVNEVPVANVSMTSDHKIKLVVKPEMAKATIVLRDLAGHLLYTNTVNLRTGINQTFNIDDLAFGTYQLAVTVGQQSTVKTFVIEEHPAQTVVTLQS